MITIDLNCDLGEWKDADGSNKDAAIMPFITSCNIACGGHIGDQKSMISTIKLAKQHKVAVGAHPSYPDRENFGRKVLEIPNKELIDSLVHQLEVFVSLVKQEEERLHHIKPHGALYNEASINVNVAEMIIQAILNVGIKVPIYCQEGSKLDGVITDAGLEPVYEVFADRNYEDDLTLRSRGLEGAVLHNKNAVFEHIHRMIIDGKLKTFSGLIKPINANTICLHSDTRGSVELAKEINSYLKANGVNVASA